jgi:hypothetical protein
MYSVCWDTPVFGEQQELARRGQEVEQVAVGIIGMEEHREGHKHVLEGGCAPCL